MGICIETGLWVERTLASRVNAAVGAVTGQGPKFTAPLLLCSAFACDQVWLYGDGTAAVVDPIVTAGGLLWMLYLLRYVRRQSEHTGTEARTIGWQLWYVGFAFLAAVVLSSYDVPGGPSLDWFSDAGSFLEAVGIAAATAGGGGGKTVWRRAADALGRLADSLSPSPAPLGA